MAGVCAFRGIDFVLGTSGVDGVQWSAHSWGRLGAGFPMSPRSKGEPPKTPGKGGERPLPTSWTQGARELIPWIIRCYLEFSII